jgi:hypothetical protein
MTQDFITVIRSKHRRLAKLIHPGPRFDDYDKVRTIDACMVSVANLDGLFFHLDCLLPRSDLAIVRGSIIGARRVHDVRRLIRNHDAESDGAAIFEEAAHHWVCLDIDGIHRPDDVPPADLLGCAGCALDLLPGEFRPARCVVQATAGHGLKPGSRLRLWFWASRALIGRELSRWLRASPVDAHLFTPNQVCYTAQPLFAPGLADHLPYRMADRPGTECVEAPSAEALAPPPPPHYTPPRRMASTDQRATRIMTTALTRVEMSAAGGHHDALRAAAFTIGGLLDSAAVSETEATSALMAAIGRAAGAEANATKDLGTIESGLRAGRERPLLLTGGKNG